MNPRMLALAAPASSARTVELTTALLFVCLALALRWAPTYRATPVDGWRRVAAVATRWIHGPRRPTPGQSTTAVLTGCAVGMFFGGSAAIPTGLLAAGGAFALSTRRLSEREVRARHRLVAAAPPAADLFAAALASGLLPADAAIVVATAFGDPDPQRAIAQIADRFAAAGRALRGGTDPELAWRALSVDAATAAVGAAALRAGRTGAPAAATVAKAARDSWSAAEQAAQAQIHSVAVRATAPLALCFLPAFILVGVAPTAIGLLTEIKP